MTSKRDAYTLVELVIIFLIASIVFAAGVPAFHKLTESHGLKGARDQLKGHFMLARTKAVAEQIQHIWQWSKDTETYIISRDDNDNDKIDPGEPFIGPFHLPKNIALDGSQNHGTGCLRVTFTASGSAWGTESIVLTNERGHSIELTVLFPTGILKEIAEN